MRSKLTPILASFILIFSILACNLPGGQSSNQPDLAATITAQAMALQAGSSTPIPSDTPLPVGTPLTANTPLPANTSLPANTPLPAAPSKPKNFKTAGSATAITFSWDDNSLNETGFRIYQDGVTAPLASIDAHPATGGMSYNSTASPADSRVSFPFAPTTMPANPVRATRLMASRFPASLRT